MEHKLVLTSIGKKKENSTMIKQNQF